MSPSWCERLVLSQMLKLTCRVKPIRRQRQMVVLLERGEVLEIGIGTGLNLPFKDRTLVKCIAGVDPGLEMHPLALRRVAQAGLSVRMRGLSAEALPQPDHGFGTVVCTYALCTIPDLAGALAEIRRVLAPAGNLLFSVHDRAPDESVRRWQPRLQPLWGRG